MKKKDVTLNLPGKASIYLADVDLLGVTITPFTLVSREVVESKSVKYVVPAKIAKSFYILNQR